MSKSFRRRIDRHKNNISFLDGRRNICTEEQIAATGTLYDIVQAGFKNREVVAIPGVNSSLVDIDHSHFYIRALVGDNGHSGATDITRANAKNPSIVIHNM